MSWRMTISSSGRARNLSCASAWGRNSLIIDTTLWNSSASLRASCNLVSLSSQRLVTLSQRFDNSSLWAAGRLPGACMVRTVSSLVASSCWMFLNCSINICTVSRSPMTAESWSSAASALWSHSSRLARASDTRPLVSRASSSLFWLLDTTCRTEFHLLFKLSTMPCRTSLSGSWATQRSFRFLPKRVVE